MIYLWPKCGGEGRMNDQYSFSLPSQCSPPSTWQPSECLACARSMRSSTTCAANSTLSSLKSSSRASSLWWASSCCLWVLSSCWLVRRLSSYFFFFYPWCEIESTNMNYLCIILREDFSLDGSFLLSAGSVLRKEQHSHHRLSLRAPAHNLVLVLLWPSASGLHVSRQVYSCDYFTLCSAN